MAVILTVAGHGGADPGAPNPYLPGRPEKMINLEIDQAFYRLARAAGHSVHRMRTGDAKADYSQIVPTAQSVGADVVIEIHTNSSTGREARGVEVWCLRSSPADASGLAAAMARDISMAIPTANRGVKYAYSGWSPYSRFVNMSTSLPKAYHVLTENGFISNAQDEMRLRDPKVIEAIAYAHLTAMHGVFGWPVPEPPPEGIEKYLPWLLIGGAVAVGGIIGWLLLR